MNRDVHAGSSQLRQTFHQLLILTSLELQITINLMAII